MLKGRVLVLVAGVSAMAATSEAPAEASEGALSIGSPTDGALRGGMALEARPFLELRWPDGPRWGLPSMVRMLERAAQRVHRHRAGSVLLVGELSNERGGDLAGHASHESGRDADVGFYYRTAEGKSVRTRRLMKVDDRGRVIGEENLLFDVERNWQLVQAFLTDPEVVVQRIFVARSLRERLLAHAGRAGAPPRVVERARFALHQPSGHPHDDHFHVRIACPRDQRTVCIPTPTIRQAQAGRGARRQQDG